MKELIEKGISSVSKKADRLFDELGANVSLFKEKVYGLPFFASIEKNEEFTDVQYDEKHYFIVPYAISEHGFALHIMRCLPQTAPEINNLPKRRVFHFAHEHAENQVKRYLLESARDITKEKRAGSKSSLEALADDIDALDNKLTYGMILVGGLAAIFNPMLGAGIAANALIPGIGGILNKYGLRPTGEKMSKLQLEKEIKQAEERVAKEFECATTLRVINPILAELHFALCTTEEEHDPLLDPSLENGSIPELSHERWRALTEKAICHVYKEVFSDKSKHEAAKLGPEDLRWLKTFFEAHRT